MLEPTGRMRRLLQTLAVALIAGVSVEGLWQANLLSWADNYISDVWHVFQEPTPVEDLPVLLVAIDDESLEKIKDPRVFWGPHLSDAVSVLHQGGATVVGLDLLFAVSGENWLHDNIVTDEFLAATSELPDTPALDDLVMKTRTWDGSFRMQVATGQVIMVTFTQPDPSREEQCMNPMKEFTAMLPSGQSHMGYANLGEDPDGVLRRFPPVIRPEPRDAGFTADIRRRDRCPSLQFASVLALHHLDLDPLAFEWELPNRRLGRDDADRIPIHYAGPAGTFPSIPFYKVANNDLTDAERALIAGRVALVGTTYTSAHDVWMTPYDRLSRAQGSRMPGFEAQANAITTLVNGTAIHALRAWQRALLFMGLGVTLGGIFAFASLQSSSALVIVQTAAWPVAGYFLFSLYDIVLPTASMSFLGLAVFGAIYALRFSGEARERAFLRQVFSRYVSDEVVGEILSSPEGLGLGGVEREITILFTDIRNFTTISERLEPEEVVEMLNAYFARVCPHILDNRGRVDKFIGDAVMAVFGAPVQQPDHARQALKAAMGLSKECDRFKRWMKQRFSDRDLPEFEIGIGIHTGLAVAGNIGFEQVTEYAVIGDAVNTASRLEGLTKRLGVRILVSRQTVEAAGGGVKTGIAEEVKVKGRAEPVEILEFIRLD